MPDYPDLAYALGGYGRKSNPFEARRKLGLQLIQQGSDTSPIQSPWQGVGRLAQALAGGFDMYQADKDEKDADKKRSDALAQAMAEPDPQKRIGLIAAYDPDTGARAAGQLAIEQAKIQTGRADLAQRGQAYGFGPPGQMQTATGQPSPLQPPPDGTVPPGDFANNSGNIRSTAPGNSNGFATFPTPQAGANAHFQNYQAYIQQNPNITVAQALAKWSPPNENNTNGIISQISEATGINPGMPLSEVLKDPMVAARLLDAQTRLEKGGLPQGFNADTFIAASGGPQQAAPGVPGAVAAPPVGAIAQAPLPPPGQPSQIAQGGGDGTPPQPSPQGIAGPAVVAPPAPPQRMSVDQSPRQVMEPFVRRLMTGGYGNGPEAEIKMRTEAQAALDRDYDTRKLVYDQQQGDYRAQRDQAIKEPGQATQNEAHAREQFNNLQTVKDYRKSQAVFQSAVKAAGTNSAAADLNLVYAFATMMDPGSVVREGEMGMVKATQNASDQVKAMVSAVTGGQRISPDARQALVDQMHVRYESLKAQHDELGQAYGSMAERSGMKRDNVVLPIPEVKWTRNPATATGGLPPPPPGFRPIQ